MKHARALLFLALVVAGCRDAVAPTVPVARIAAVDALRASLVVTPSGVTYTAIDLGSFGGTYADAVAVNQSGQVVGFSYTANNAAFRAFRWEAGVMTDLGTLGGDYAYPYAINSAGAVAGYSYTSGNAQVHAFLATGSTMTDLGTLDGDYASYATDVNDAGQVCGISYGSSGGRVFIWQGGTMTALGSLGGSAGWPQAMNSHGDVAGYAYLPGDQSYHAVLWHNGTVVDLGDLGGTYSYALDINDAGQVTGYAFTSGGALHAFRWQSGTMTDLGTLGGGYSYPSAIGRNGDVVGHSYTSDYALHATLWRNGGGVVDLGTINGQFSVASAINDLGQVTGYAYTADGYYRTFLWENGVMTDLGDIGGGTAYAQYRRAINNRGQIVGTGVTADFSSYHPVLWDPSNPVLTVTVDIKPGSTPNSINPKNKGVIPVAILSSATFDATTVDALSVRFGPGKAAEAHGKGHIEDANGDGILDMVLHFDTQASGIVCATTSADLTGNTVGGQQIKGSDAVSTTGCK